MPAHEWNIFLGCRFSFMAGRELLLFVSYMELQTLGQTGEETTGPSLWNRGMLSSPRACTEPTLIGFFRIHKVSLQTPHFVAWQNFSLSCQVSSLDTRQVWVGIPK
jgi:hypothetical protein